MAEETRKKKEFENLMIDDVEAGRRPSSSSGGRTRGAIPGLSTTTTGTSAVEASAFTMPTPVGHKSHDGTKKDAKDVASSFQLGSTNPEKPDGSVETTFGKHPVLDAYKDTKPEMSNTARKKAELESSEPRRHVDSPGGDSSPNSPSDGGNQTQNRPRRRTGNFPVPRPGAFHVGGDNSQDDATDAFTVTQQTPTVPNDSGGEQPPPPPEEHLLSAELVQDHPLATAVPLKKRRQRLIIIIVVILAVAAVAVTLGFVLGTDDSPSPSPSVMAPPPPTPPPTPLPTGSPTVSSAPSMAPTIASVEWTIIANFTSTEQNFGRTMRMSDDASVVAVGSVGQLTVHRQQLGGWDAEDIGPFGRSNDYAIAFDMSPDGNVLAVADTVLGLQGTYYTGTSWFPLGNPSFNPYGPTYVDEFIRGEFVAMAGENLMAVGDADNERVDILVLEGSVWRLQQTLTDPENAASRNSNFGFAVDMSDDGLFLAVGAREAGTTSRGAIYVFMFDGSSWVLRGDDPIWGVAPDDRFGYAVSISADGSVVAGGSNFFGAYNGHARVFEWNGQEYQQRGDDLVGDEDTIEFGRVIALNADGNYLAIGSIFDAPSGRAYVYAWTGTEWVQRGQTLLGFGSYGEFGSSLALSADGDILAVGEPYESSVVLFQARAV